MCPLGLTLCAHSAAFPVELKEIKSFMFTCLQELGRDPGPAEPEGTMRAEDHEAIWLVPRDPPPATGIDEQSGARIPPGEVSAGR
jgi:hypothetical protein